MTHRVVATFAAKQNLRSAYVWAAERAPETALIAVVLGLIGYTVQ